MQAPDSDRRRVPARYVRMKEVLERTGYSSRTIFRRIKEGRFPEPTKLDAHTNAWPIEDFEEWMQAPDKWRKKEVCHG